MKCVHPLASPVARGPRGARGAAAGAAVWRSGVWTVVTGQWSLGPRPQAERENAIGPTANPHGDGHLAELLCRGRTVWQASGGGRQQVEEGLCGLDPRRRAQRIAEYTGKNFLRADGGKGVLQGHLGGLAQVRP